MAAMIAFARRVAHLVEVTRIPEYDGDELASVRYDIDGTLFFASSNDLYESFHYVEDPERVTLDFSQARIRDASTVAALDSIMDRYRRGGHQVKVVGLDPSSARIHERLTGHLNRGEGAV